MLNDFPFYLILVIVILLLIMLSNKIKVAYPVLLVLGGLAISFIPGIPVLRIDPELIFVIFLPPLLYEAAWNISWKELWRWRRIICSFAFLVVFITAFSVALVASHFIPGFSLALGFLLGGIISPPDAVSAGAILKFVKVPRRLSSILEGESLLNDASSLIIFRFALITVGTGQFIWQDAITSFGWMLFGGVGIGVGIGFIAMKLHKYLPTDANSDIILSLVTPYIIYIAAEEVHSSGVLAVVSGGLLLSHFRLSFLSSSSRLRGVNVWESFCFILNGLIFMFIGLDLPEIVSGLEGVSLSSAIGYGLLITAVLIVGRILCAFGAVFTTLIARNFIKVADARHPGFRGPILIGWTGMRGVVSLAAALSIPVQLDGAPFPQRNLILFITFVVILTTLLLQGLTLPYLIKKFHMKDPDYTLPEDEIYNQIKRELADHALNHLKSTYSNELERQPILQQIARKWEDIHVNNEDNILMSDETKVVYLNLLEHQRKWLLDKNQEEILDEEIIRRHLLYLDLEEEKLQFM
ncbi:sodium/proton antiporter (CPA1 family) [Flavobacterium sp. 90]|uniref:Na+/H+ antiporter n=1 Tax=unclassified Flavobacterium TaxID=196869 RepID=UPI000EAB9344|nr:MULTISPECIES: Na+/H+ antiporter [unclassified Flavobacterium]RKR05867.1 sodium/proton antiporter (CPA1 family) [Flavobacterium sp. 81]TCK57177.1 sodium/proton antiporter (CPA1 family) [Flavobacterium sp. 90]